jgi:hypothetical protein
MSSVARQERLPAGGRIRAPRVLDLVPVEDQQERHPGLSVVLVTASESSDRVDEGLAAGGVAHVPKTRAWEDLVEVMGAAIAQRV